MPEQQLYSFYQPHDPVQLDCGTELITKQSHKAECDINTILKQFSQTGIIDHINKHQAEYIDLPDNLDFQTSLDIINQANDAFASLPSLVRDHYQNDPARFLGALTDPSQRSKLEEYGIFKPRPPEEPPAPSVDAQK